MRFGSFRLLIAVLPACPMLAATAKAFARFRCQMRWLKRESQLDVDSSVISAGTADGSEVARERAVLAKIGRRQIAAGRSVVDMIDGVVRHNRQGQIIFQAARAAAEEAKGRTAATRSSRATSWSTGSASSWSTRRWRTPRASGRGRSAAWERICGTRFPRSPK
jgi:hypothetical protein